MEKLNINTLFSPNEQIRNNDVKSPISINTLFNKKKTKKKMNLL